MSEKIKSSSQGDHIILPPEVIRRLNEITSIVDTIAQVPVTFERRKFLLSCLEQLAVELTYLEQALME